MDPNYQSSSFKFFQIFHPFAQNDTWMKRKKISKGIRKMNHNRGSFRFERIFQPC